MLKKLKKWVLKAGVMHHIKGIKSRDFSIIASNCTGTLPYRFLRMQHLSPTVNLLFYAPCYIKFVSRLDYYLSLKLEFVTESRYPEAADTHKRFNYYPIGVLDDIEVHFMHYTTEQDAEEKWERRKKRVNSNNLIFAFTDRDLCTPELALEFDKLPGRKIMLTAQHCPWLKSAVHIPAYHGQSEMGDGYTNYHHLSHINFRQLVDGPVAESASNAEVVEPLSTSV